ncbi:MAG TPA: pseudouridine synthase [Flavobacteriaceae bacterium]|nr:23S rRNA pseudouridine synthase F [Flavobacteriaceae bacterium]HJO70476.1 pseudouridine synthase [Flavobacteriaceae bacterium]
MEGKIRINKFLSEVGFCSRRGADKIISQGRVYINGEIAVLGSKVNRDDLIKVDGELISNQEEKVYLAFNKPVGIECTGNQKVKNNIIDYINFNKRLFTIGRIDKDSEGLILLTNNGDIVNNVLRAENKNEKEYLVTLNKKIDKDFIQKMRSGVRIMGKLTKKCYVEKTYENKFKIVLTQGLNRQIRRMCNALGYRVTKLKRIRVMDIKLDTKVGEYRFLNESEVKQLF